MKRLRFTTVTEVAKVLKEVVKVDNQRVEELKGFSSHWVIILI